MFDNCEEMCEILLKLLLGFQGKMSSRASRTLYVGNLPGDIRQREVKDLFYKVLYSFNFELSWILYVSLSWLGSSYGLIVLFCWLHFEAFQVFIYLFIIVLLVFFIFSLSAFVCQHWALFFPLHVYPWAQNCFKMIAWWKFIRDKEIWCVLLDCLLG